MAVLLHRPSSVCPGVTGAYRSGAADSSVKDTACGEVCPGDCTDEGPQQVETHPGEGIDGERDPRVGPATRT